MIANLFGIQYFCVDTKLSFVIMTHNLLKYRFVLVHTGASACMGSQSKQYQSKVLAPVWYKIEPHNGLHRYILAVPICNEPGAKLSHPTQQCTLCSMIMFTTVVNLRSQNICNFSPFDFVFWLAFLPHVHSSTCCFVFWP